MPPRPPPLLRLCPKHGIVAGPDGRCVICLRGDDRARGRARAHRSALQVIGGLTLIVAIAGGVIAWKLTSRRQAQGLADVQAREALAPRAPPAPVIEDEGPPTLDARQAAVRDATQAQRQRDIEAEMRRVPIRMFVDDKCDLCGTARDWLKREGLTYTEVDVGADPSALAALTKLTPTPTVPSFDVDGEVLVGFGPSLVLGAVRRAADRRTR